MASEVKVEAASVVVDVRVLVAVVFFLPHWGTFRQEQALERASGL